MLIAYGFRALYPVVWVGTKNGVAFSFCEILATVNPTLNAGRRRRPSEAPALDISDAFLK